MSDENVSSPENSADPKVNVAPAVRRISNPRPKKPNKADLTENPIAPNDTERENFQPSEEHEDSNEEPSSAGADWPPPEAESSGGSPSQTESAKRKRRRRKGKGSSAGPPTDENKAASGPIVAETPREENRPRPQHEPPPAQRPKIDSELLSQMAWKIYLAEVSEEGVALISDNDAKDLSRRCFRLAEIFIEEQFRKR